VKQNQWLALPGAAVGEPGGYLYPLSTMVRDGRTIVAVGIAAIKATLRSKPATSDQRLQAVWSL
jgi:hypothetical protein